MHLVTPKSASEPKRLERLKAQVLQRPSFPSCEKIKTLELLYKSATTVDSSPGTHLLSACDQMSKHEYLYKLLNVFIQFAFLIYWLLQPE